MPRFVSTFQDGAPKIFSHLPKYPVLFSIGLSIYLWNIHIGVAVPVIAVTSIAALFYLAATVLPLVYDFCPYTTAFSRLSKEQARKWLQKKQSPGDTDVASDKVPMDIVTSRALSWMISNCETSNSVDITLQAIAGADHSLPCAPLLKCGAAAAVVQRLEACFSSRQLSVTDEGFASLVELGPESQTFRMAVLYARVLSFLALHGNRDVPDPLEQSYDYVWYPIVNRFTGLYRRLVCLFM
jgi:hypothetical protein